MPGINYAPNRREFLTRSSLAVAGTVLGARALWAGQPVLISRQSPLPVDAFLPDPVPAETLEALATQCLDAARSAGASYADVRVSEYYQMIAESFRVLVYSRCAYGIRTMVDGHWGFAHGTTPATDAVALCARESVTSARLAAQTNLRRRTGTVSATSVDDWTPAPAVTGEWSTPIVVDPFTVPVQQHAELQAAVSSAVESVPGAHGTFEVQWIKERRIFATSTGTMVTQHLCRVAPTEGPLGGAEFGQYRVPLAVPGLHSASGGYEVLATPDLADRFKANAEEAVQLVRLPVRPFDVGRYPIVLDGNIMSNVLTQLVGPSLELDRVLGLEESGSSRWTFDRLGTPVASPLMTVVGHRAMPSATAVRWDDDGITPEEHTVIQNGILTDYHTTAHTVSSLASWYQQHGKPVRSNGCAVAVQAQCPVQVQSAHLTMTPGTRTASVEALCKEIQRGIVAINVGWIRTDQQFTSGAFDSSWGGLFEVSRGTIVRRLTGVGLEFSTQSFLKNLTALGDSTTVRTRDVTEAKGVPWVEARYVSTAPAALFKEINVVSTSQV